MSPRTCFAGLILLQALFFCVPAYSEEQAGSEPISVPEVDATAETKKLYDMLTGQNPFTGSRLIYLPSGDLYPPYAADPVRPGFAIQPVYVRKGDIPSTSDRRINLKAGGQVGLVRSHSRTDPDLGWQVSLLGGFNDQNDVRENLDNIGWDGHYGLVLTSSWHKRLAFKLGWLHVSSHLGDEYIERTGRKRISYTREEIAAGVSWGLLDHWRIYMEGGKAINMSNEDLQEPWRRQAGLEYESNRIFWRKRMAWYAALDAQSFQERDWRIDLSFQTGFLIRSEGHNWRFGVEWYNGRPPIGEFFQFTERYVSMGIWIDI